MDELKTVTLSFLRQFGENPLLRLRSPGRINLLGEHTDYNQGFVLPAAIDRSIWFAISPRSGPTIRLYAVNLEEGEECSLERIVRSGAVWPNYLLGVVDVLKRSGREIGGFDCAFGGDIPQGAGLSSSAAIEAGLALALDHLFGLGLDRLSLAKLAQQAENEFVGVRCGIMDQYANLFGRAGQVLHIDCRSLTHVHLPFDSTRYTPVLFNSRVSHSLASSEYNRRRAECERGVGEIRKSHPEVGSLRDVTPDMLEECRADLDPVVYRRCRYVTGENRRLQLTEKILEESDLPAFGRLMNETHRGLRDDYEVSCPELDFLVEAACQHDAVIGARMMGGGFGGCTLNLVERDAVDKVGERVLNAYRKQFKITGSMITTSIADGTSIIDG